MEIYVYRAVKLGGVDYPQGLQTVSDTIGAALIELGAARSKYPPPATFPVSGTVDPVTGGIGKVTSAGKDIATSAALGALKKQTTISAMVPLMPSYDATALTLTQNLMMTAPGHFDAVAIVAINVGAAMTIDSAAVAVSERSDTSKTVPIIGGTQYNALAAVGTQQGWVPVTWNAGSASVVVAIGTLAQPTIKLSDWIPLSSVDRVESGKTFPLVMARTYINNRTHAAHPFSTAAQQDAFGAALAPYECYNVAQSSVDGVSNPAALTATWIAGSNTTAMRIFGLAFRMRGCSDLILFVGDSITKGVGAGGDVGTNTALNVSGGWSTKSALALASLNRPVGFINAGIGGQTSAQYLQRGKDMIAAIRPTIATYTPYTPNDAPTTVSAISAEFSRALDFVDTCVGAGTIPVLVSPVPYSAAGSEALRQSVIDKIAAIRNVAVINPNVAGVYDAANSGGYYWAAGAQIDNTHPSLAGYSAIATLAAIPALSGIVN